MLAKGTIRRHTGKLGGEVWWIPKQNARVPMETVFRGLPLWYVGTPIPTTNTEYDAFARIIYCKRRYGIELGFSF